MPRPSPRPTWSCSLGWTGDNNPVHCNEVFAAQTQFKSRIAHGMFCAGLISCVAGTRLCRGRLHLRRSAVTLQGAGAVIGDTVTATCTITEINTERRRVIMSTICTVQDKVVVEGTAVFMVSRRGT